MTKQNTKVKNDSFISLTEKFNQHKLNHIIENEDLYRSKMRIFDSDYNPFAIATKYLNKSKNGVIQTVYKQNESFGRFHSLGSLSLQALPREIRHTISSEFYVDIDMRNAHPVILEHLCFDKNISCKYLRKYNSDRDKFLSELCDDKNQAKTVILSLINGGKKAVNEITSGPSWLNDFKTEIKNIHSQFSKDAEFKLHKKKRIDNGIDYNHEASYMNTLLCDFENNILQIIYKGLDSPRDCVLCFDGLMIRNTTVFNLSKLESIVKQKLDIDIKLVVKDMTDGFDLQDVDPFIEQQYNTFDFTDPYTYNDFRNEFNGSTFNSYQDMEEALSKYPKVIASISKGSGCFIKKLGGGKFDMTTNLKTSGFNISYMNDSNKKTKIKFEDYLCSNDSFSEIACELDVCPANKFNIWSGFQAKRVNVPESDGFKLMKSFILETWANNNIEYYNYIISWFAGLVTNLKGINKVALAMVSSQGTGKNTLLDFMSYILGSSNMVSVDGIKSVTDSFNYILQNKRLININEMSSTKEEFRSNFDKIKRFITDSTITITPKGIDSYTMSNIGNYVLFTNHRDAIIVENTDRRYAVFEMSGIYANNSTYFNNLYSLCFNQDVANEFYTYLLDFSSIDLSKIPDTELKQEMMTLSRPTPLRFLDSVIEDNLFDGETKIKATVMYATYRRWCDENGERNITTSTKFGTIINTKIQKKRKNDGWYYNISTIIQESV